MIITNKNGIYSLNLNNLPISNIWSSDFGIETKMHRIHSYPARFPAFLVSKSLGYAKRHNIHVRTIADIFCGCGTTALEAKREGINFWGCDINPVATLIAKVKSDIYNIDCLENYLDKILCDFNRNTRSFKKKINNNSRINYWFSKREIKDLTKLLAVIDKNIPDGKYRRFFLCAFSNILKGCSRWLTKSIKPQVDPNKNPKEVKTSFMQQVAFMIQAVAEQSGSKNAKCCIENIDFLKTNKKTSFVDILITSPPYVTSYEYADLHQLSSLWIGYCNDYRDLRDGTIGSLYHSDIPEEREQLLNKVGLSIYKQLMNKDKFRAKHVAKYFIDIRKSLSKAYMIINNKGMAFFVVGNTRYKDVCINNAKYMVECLLDTGFKRINVFKRKISSKILTPYRTKDGKFSKNPKNRKIYGCEFVLIAEK